MPLTWIAVRPQPIAAAKREEEPAIPAIREAEAEFHGCFCLFGHAQRQTNAAGCRGSVLPSRSRLTPEERSDLPQFLTKSLFAGQCQSVRVDTFNYCYRSSSIASIQSFNVRSSPRIPK